MIISFIAPIPPKGDKPKKEIFMITLKMLLQKTTKVIDNQSNQLCQSVKLWQSVATQIRQIIDYQISSPRSPEGGQVGKRDFYDNSQNALTKKLQKLLIIRVINFAKVSCLCGSHLWQSVATQK